MVRRVLERPVKKAEVIPNVCAHHWVIESAHGHTSQGFCKVCGIRREFYNSIPEYPEQPKDKSVLSLPALPGVEFDGEKNKH